MAETKVLPRILAISNSLSLAEPFETWLRRLRSARISMVQIREKHLDDRALFERVQLARRELPPPCLLLVNGRIDLAIAAGADGVHLPSKAPPTVALRKRFGSRLLLGRSTHHLSEISREAEEGADYVTFGPVFSTPSKATYGPPQGLEMLPKATRGSLPVFALGGLSQERFSAVSAAGAWGVAGIGMFQEDSLASLMSSAAAVFGAEGRAKDQDRDRDSEQKGGRP